MKRYVNIKQLTNTIGLSPRTIRKWIVNPVNPIPCFRVGGKLLFEESEMTTWLEGHRIKTIDIEAMADELLTSFTKGKK